MPEYMDFSQNLGKRNDHPVSCITPAQFRKNLLEGLEDEPDVETVHVGNIIYHEGDATNPVGDKNVIIPHICNDVGGWGRGFVLALSKKWPIAETSYRAWSEGENTDAKICSYEGIGFNLGNVQFVNVERGICVANMIGQRGIESQFGIPPIRYEDVNLGLRKVAKRARLLNADVHMPRIGSGLAGGKWEKIEEIIKRTLVLDNIDVFVYDLPQPVKL